jgi:hypothetical protein
VLFFFFGLNGLSQGILDILPELPLTWIDRLRGL